MPRHYWPRRGLGLLFAGIFTLSPLPYSPAVSPVSFIYAGKRGCFEQTTIGLIPSYSPTKGVRLCVRF